jgi:putative SbcD/Mre11-related phosphoesterase
MKVLDNLELVDLAIYTNKSLIFADFHIGYEEALNKQGLMVPRFQFREIISRLNLIFRKLGNRTIDRILVNGDIKHEFGTVSEQEWRHTLKLLDYFGRHCKEIVLIKGNHDTILGPIARKRGIRVVDHFIINGILVIHGHKIPLKSVLKGIKTIIIGHEHPAVSVREGPRAESFKAYLIGKWENKNLIVQPSFNLVTEGTDVLKEELLSPFLKQNLGNFDILIAADKMYRFGKLKDLS